MPKTKEQRKISNTKGKELVGVVVSDKMRDTAVVEVSRLVKHKKYGKFIKHTKRYKVHDSGNKCSVGDKVRIKECAPLSKEKHFQVVAE